LALKYQERLNCDVLKVAHHGSDTSSSDLFLKYAKPAYFIISVGYNNIYHLPDHHKLLSLKNLYRTDYDGTIYFYQKNGKLFVKKEGKND
jgi:competence protein ComEC